MEKFIVLPGKTHKGVMGWRRRNFFFLQEIEHTHILSSVQGRRPRLNIT